MQLGIEHTGVPMIPGLIEFSPDIGLSEQVDQGLVVDSIRAQKAIADLSSLPPSFKRFSALHVLRVSARSCPMAALALGCLFAATIYRRPRRNRATCRLWGLSVRFSAERLNRLEGQVSVRYEMTLRQTAVEGLRLLAIDALEQCDRIRAVEYLGFAEDFDVGLEDFAALQPRSRRRI